MLSRTQQWLLALADPQGARLDRLGRSPRPKDLGGLWDLADRHGVLPAVVQNARAAMAAAAPSATEDAFAAAQGPLSRRLALAALLRGQLAPITRALLQGGVPAAVLKGPDFADRLYPARHLRPFTDLDLLAPPERRHEVFDVLKSLGYQPLQAGMKYQEGYGEMSWRLADRPGGCVEVHWNLVNSPTLRRGLSVEFDDLQWQRSDGCLPAATPAALLLLASVHAAASHGFDRLQLLCDVVQIVRGRAGAPDLDWLGQAASRTGASLALAASLDLAGRLLDHPPCLELKSLLKLRTFPFFRLVLSPAVVLRAHAYRDSFRRQIFRQRIKKGGRSGLIPSQTQAPR